MSDYLPDDITDEDEAGENTAEPGAEQEGTGQTNTPEQQPGEPKKQGVRNLQNQLQEYRDHLAKVVEQAKKRKGVGSAAGGGGAKGAGEAAGKAAGKAAGETGKQATVANAERAAAARTAAQATKATAKAAEKTAEKVAQTAINEMGREGLRTGVTAAGGSTVEFWGPALLIILGLLFALIIFALIVLLIAFFIIALANNGDDGMNININKTGPSYAPNGETISYSINVSFPGVADDVIIKDEIPENSIYVEATEPVKLYDGSGQTTTEPAQVKKIEWSLKEITGATTATDYSQQSVTLTVRPLNSDIWVINKGAEATVINPQSSDPSNSAEYDGNDCSGYYANFLEIPLGNFGDKECELAGGKAETISNIYQQFLDSGASAQDADDWTNIVAARESSYIPNAYNGNAVDEGGAYGLVQMGASYDYNDLGQPDKAHPGLPIGAKGRNGLYDRGDVPWRIQISNAVEYNKLLANNGKKWCYWRTCDFHGQECMPPDVYQQYCTQ